jgi:hypothetical protein
MFQANTNHGRCKGPYRESASSGMPYLRLKKTPQPPYSLDICPSYFLLFGWLKGKVQQQFTDPNQLYEATEEIFSSLSFGMIEDVFRNWIHRLMQVITSDGNYIQ